MGTNITGFRGYIFDLDGVIVDTRPYHLMAWKRLANELGVEIDQQSNEILRGLSRMGGIEKIMEWGHLYASEAEKMFWSDLKNGWYIEYVSKLSPEEVLPGVLDFLSQLKMANIPTALVSSSTNAKKVLLSIGLDPYFDLVIDGNIYKKSKPAPDCFLIAAEGIGRKPSECVVFEDAPIGVLAAKRGGFSTVAVGIHRQICGADMEIADFIGLIANTEFNKNLIYSESE